MTEITTDHYNGEGGQVTIRTVTVTDATGQEYQHEFKEKDNGAHEYLGDGRPPKSAAEAIVEFEEELRDD